MLFTNVAARCRMADVEAASEDAVAVDTRAAQDEDVDADAIDGGTELEEIGYFMQRRPMHAGQKRVKPLTLVNRW